MRPRDLFDLCMLALLWGGVYLFVRAAVPAFGPLPLSALQLGIAALVLLPAWLARERRVGLRRLTRPLVVQGLVFCALPYALLAWGAMSMHAGLAALLDATAPLFAAIVARCWLGEPIARGRVLGLLLGFGGVVLLVGDGVSVGSGLALAAVLTAAMLLGVGGLYAQHRLRDTSPLTLTTGSLAVSALALTPFALAARPEELPGTRAWAELLCLAVPCSGLGYLLYYRLVRNVGATRAVAATFLSPLVALVAGALYLDEPITPRTIAGAVVILAGTALALAGRRDAEVYGA